MNEKQAQGMISVTKVMLRLIMRSLFAKPITLDQKTIEALEDVSTQQAHFKIDYDHYARYEHAMQWPSDFTHPCYMQVLTLPMQLQLLALPVCPIKPLGLIHIHNRIMQTPDFDRGQPFDITVKFGQLLQHEKGLAVEVLTLAKQDGSLVYQATSTYLSRTTSSDSLALKEASHLPYLRPPANLSRRDLTTYTFSANSGRRYASLSGDFNPIHLSFLSAKLFGFKRAIIHGMASLALTISKEETALRFDNSDSPLEIDCDFLKPIYLPSSIQIVTGCIDTDRFISAHAIDDKDRVHLLIRYARGEATRLYRRFA